MGNPEDQASLKKTITALTKGNTEVETLMVTLEKKRYLAALTFMKEIGWLNIVLIDVSQVVQIMDFLPIIAVIILSLLLVLTVVTVMLNRTILRPLSILTDASRLVSRGKYDISIPVTGTDEIGQLTATFNAMTAKVLDYTSNLERKVQERTVELIDTNRALETSNEQIMDSIHCARMIQDAILPDSTLFFKHLKDFFIIYTPRDIVGGDFYYFRETGKNFLIAVIDCTGHGVPGAFVTMTVNSVLNHVVDAICADDPSRILIELNRIIRDTLHHGKSDLLIDSGLDIAILYCRPKEKTATFAGAGLSLYCAGENEIEEIKGNRQRVGYKGSKTNFTYTNHEIQLTTQACLYITTDGLLDQAGGAKGYGFGRQRLVDMIRQYFLLTMKEQEEIYTKKLNEYKGGTPQRDDILFLGFRI
jgi:serine phosphatase RsbU (regulator of sigma subunit)